MNRSRFGCNTEQVRMQPDAVSPVEKLSMPKFLLLICPIQAPLAGQQRMRDHQLQPTRNSFLPSSWSGVSRQLPSPSTDIFEQSTDHWCWRAVTLESIQYHSLASKDDSPDVESHRGHIAIVPSPITGSWLQIRRSRMDHTIEGS